MEKVVGVAISGGPGSFTGLRIGMATAKALAQGRNIPLVSVPTLQALAYTQCISKGLVSPVMNARKSEVYTALFSFQGLNFTQVETDRAIAPSDWVKVLAVHGQPVVFVGDGVDIYSTTWSELGELAVRPLEILQGARASTVAWLGRRRLMAGERDDLYSLKPFYIRPVEAELKLACPK